MEPDTAQWERLQRAYRALISDDDPAGPLIAELGAHDCRPGSTVGDGVGAGPVVLSGRGDLQELREAVERVTGPGSWPLAGVGSTAGTALSGRVVLERPAPAVALVTAMEPLIRDHGGAWRTWKTMLEAVAAAVGAIELISIEAVVLDRWPD